MRRIRHQGHQRPPEYKPRSAPRVTFVDQRRAQDRVRPLLSGAQRQEANGWMLDRVELATVLRWALPEQAVKLTRELRDQPALDDELDALDTELPVHPVPLDPVGGRDDDGVGEGL